MGDEEKPDDKPSEEPSPTKEPDIAVEKTETEEPLEEKKQVPEISKDQNEKTHNENEKEDAASKEADGDDGFETPEEGNGNDEEVEEHDEEEPEEEATNKELDEDEMIESPAYIPKHGRYYMHDSRTTNVEENLEEEKKKTSRADKKWSHDRFDEKLQMPKSRKQLVDRYGYDIRSSEAKEDGDAPEVDRSDERKAGPQEEKYEEATSRQRRQNPRFSNRNANHSQDARNEEEVEERPAERRGVRRGDGRGERGRGYRAPEGGRRERGGGGERWSGGGGERRSGGGGGDQWHDEGSRRGGGERGRGRGYAAREQQRDKEYGERERGSYADRGRGERGRGGRGMRGRSDGEDREHPRQFTRTVISSSYRGGGDRRGGGPPSTATVHTGPKRYSAQRPEGAVFAGGPPLGASSAGDHREEPSLPANPAKGFLPRQPTDVVYFDPHQQQTNQARLLTTPREKKIMQIVPPTM